MSSFIYLDKIKIPTKGPSESIGLEGHFEKYGRWTDLGSPESEGSVLTTAKVTIAGNNLQGKYVKVQHRESGERFWVDVLAHDVKTGGIYGLIANKLVDTALDKWQPVCFHIFHVWVAENRPEHRGKIMFVVKPSDVEKTKLVPSDLPPHEDYVGEEITDKHIHEQVTRRIDSVVLGTDEDLEFAVDKGIAPLIDACFYYGGPTVASCENNSEGKAWIQFLNPLAADDFLTGIFADGDIYWDGNKVDPADWEWKTEPFDHEDGETTVVVNLYFPPELIELLTDALMKLHHPERGEMVSAVLPEVKEEVQRLLAAIEKYSEEDD